MFRKDKELAIFVIIVVLSRVHLIAGGNNNENEVQNLNLIENERKLKGTLDDRWESSIFQPTKFVLDVKNDYLKGNSDNKNSVKRALAARVDLRKEFQFDYNDAQMCTNRSDQHQYCSYSIFSPVSGFVCKCRPTSAGKIFKEVDLNNDLVVTKEEIRMYFNTKPCVFPFTYEVDNRTQTYSTCTSSHNDLGLKWCSTKNHFNGFHALGHWKYCDVSSYDVAWQNALHWLDQNGDGKLSFDETMTNAQRRRKRRRRLPLINSAFICDDCSVPDDCLNPVVKAIDDECRNYIKTKTLNDEELLKLLANTMQDAYCTDDLSESYLKCPSKRQGMETWINRIHLEPYPRDPTSTLRFVLCSAINYTPAESRLAEIFDLLSFLTPSTDDIVNQCIQIFNSFDIFDGRDALQWATYNITKGEHIGKKILAYMGTDLANAEQILADLWSTPMSNQLMRNMAEEARQVALRENPDFITGHSLGGAVAEMVCSETGIPGASFGALGVFDPYSTMDQTRVESVLEQANMNGNIADIISDVISNYEESLKIRGFNQGQIQSLIDSLHETSPKNVLIQTEYSGLVSNTLHEGVKFEVVMNTYDLAAQPLSSIDGSACSHIASSCDMRWTWFDVEHNFGHASRQYAYNVNSYWTRGWEGQEHARVDNSQIFLPGVTKNLVCDFCSSDFFCESGTCHDGKSECIDTDGRWPTFCPNDSSKPNQRTDCDNDHDCQSNRCDPYDSVVWALLGYGQCYDKKDNGEWCNEHTDCKSGYCNWWWYCS